jgi:hypothetical protein
MQDSHKNLKFGRVLAYEWYNNEPVNLYFSRVEEPKWHDIEVPGCG